LRRYLRRGAEDAELKREIEAHLEQEIEENVARGMSREEARRRAYVRFGSRENVREEVWRWNSVGYLDDLIRDVRYALRTLARAPGFTAVVVLTLALGIGANTAIFSLIDALMLRTLPVREPGQLVELLHQFRGEPAFDGFSWDAYQIMRDGNHVFSGLIAVDDQTFDVRTEKSESQKVAGGYVDGAFFRVLGLEPAIGRLIGPEDDRMDHPSPVAVLSWSYWKGRFNSDTAILGHQIIVDNVPVTVVGVAPRGFVGLSHELTQHVWLPLALQRVVPSSGLPVVSLVGRLRPGVSMQQARAELAVLWQASLKATNANPFVRRMKLEMEPAGAGLSSPVRQQFATPLFVLMAIVSLLLLIACTNAATLLLARGAARQHEMAVRVCLGAGRLRLLRQVLTESLLLSVSGSGLGIILAHFGADALVRILTSGRPIPGMPSNFGLHVQPDLNVLLFTGGAALLTGVLFGLAPAMRAVKAAPSSALAQLPRFGETKLRRLFRKSLVITQIALSVVLLSAAGLFVGYLSKLEHLNLGFRKDHLLLVTLDLSRSGYTDEQFSRLCQELLKRLQAIPGVRSATLSAGTPLSGAGASAFAAVEGHPEHRNYVSINRVGLKFFETYGTPLLQGREFTAHDQGGPPVAMINETMARYFFGEQSPLGHHVILDHVTLQGGAKPVYEIVGVVGDAKYYEIQETAPRTVYVDTFQNQRVGHQLTLRTSLDRSAAAREIRRTVAALLKTVPVARVTTMDDQVDASIVPERLIATLSGSFGLLGGLLAAIGLYGLLAYTVARRTNELGIRIALGATRSNVMRTVVCSALGMAGAGLVVGAPLAFWGTRLAARMIPDLPPESLIIVALGSVAMVAIALVAAYVPARRAMRVDPMVALRYE
jgi:putative ABC transport system permease protein